MPDDTTPQPQDTAPTPQEPVQPPQEPQGAPANPAGDDPAALRREAATRRRQLRDAEAERDQLRSQLDSRDRIEVERRASRLLTDPTDLWGGVELADLRDDDGALDPERVDRAARDLVARKPHYRRPAEPNPDLHAGARPPAPDPSPFASAFKRAGHHR